MKARFIPILTVCVFAALVASAQKPETICGEYTYYAPENVSPEQAKNIALDRARVQAMADRWGTYIDGQIATFVGNMNGASSVDMFSFNTSDVNGEWLGFGNERVEWDIRLEDGFFIYKVSVCGLARERKNLAHVDLTTNILRNGKTERFASGEFHHGDDVYLQFQSPVRGYVAVYLLDDIGNAFCMLPYRNDPDGKIEVEHGRQYIFFDRDSARDDERQIVDAYHMRTDRIAETNYFFVIFSPNEFSKVNDNDAGKDMPRSLPTKDFQSWLARTRSRDAAMQVEILPVTVTRN
jgi:hypothetical protein